MNNVDSPLTAQACAHFYARIDRYKKPVQGLNNAAFEIRALLELVPVPIDFL